MTETQTKTKAEIERLEKETTDCLKQLTEQETALKVTQRLYENVRMAVGKDVKALRQQLQEGEACPVCGSTAHPYHQEQEVVDTLFRSIEQEYNAAVANCQQINNRSIVLQRDWTHQKMVDGQIGEQLAALYKAGIDAGNEEQIQHRLTELAERILEYRNLYAEWQRSDEEIKRCVRIVKLFVRMYLFVAWRCRKYRLLKNSCYYCRILLQPNKRDLKL